MAGPPLPPCVRVAATNPAPPLSSHPCPPHPPLPLPPHPCCCCCCCRFVFSPQGAFFREFLLDELVRSVDALSRAQLRGLLGVLGLEVRGGVYARCVRFLCGAFVCCLRGEGGWGGATAARQRPVALPSPPFPPTRPPHPDPGKHRTLCCPYWCLAPRASSSPPPRRCARKTSGWWTMWPRCARVGVSGVDAGRKCGAGEQGCAST